ncbi:unnamed protein product [Trifolium pratense]|uniref:Uncharacterized protein n=1 Tax=Trifolium pratense TaxID=57577 RepID=A0ACB0KGC0_TRIPR|nr:unnamed protein product [Trifolium pratense]
MQPHSHDNHDFSFCANDFYTSGLVELPQPQQVHQHQQQPQYLPQQHCQGHVVPITNPHGHASSNLSSSTFVALLEKQRHETNQFINMQNDQLKELLQHQWNLQLDTIRKMENLIRSLEAEKRELKRIADEREATTITLYNKLEEEKKKRQMTFVANDVESCCGENEENSARHGNNIMMLCPKCNTNSSSVLFLPCWHLSSCKTCETLLQACPICGMVKDDVVEIQNDITHN